MAFTQQSIQRPAYQLIAWEVVGVFSAATLLLFYDIQQGYAVLFGGLAYIVPHILCAWYVFHNIENAPPTSLLPKIMIGELIKMILSALLYILLAQSLAYPGFWMLMGYICAIIAFGIGVLAFIFQEAFLNPKSPLLKKASPRVS